MRLCRAKPRYSHPLVNQPLLAAAAAVAILPASSQRLWLAAWGIMSDKSSSPTELPMRAFFFDAFRPPRRVHECTSARSTARARASGSITKS